MHVLEQQQVARLLLRCTHAKDLLSKKKLAALSACLRGGGGKNFLPSSSSYMMRFQSVVENMKDCHAYKHPQKARGPKHHAYFHMAEESTGEILEYTRTLCSGE
jgi:hypothetical protein